MSLDHATPQPDAAISSPNGEAAPAPRRGEPKPALNAQGFYTFDEMVPPSAEARGNSREARRTRRMNDLEIGRMLALQALARLADGMAGKLFGEAQAIVAKLNDPYLAMSRLHQDLRRIVALEERLDEDAEERAARLAEEAATRERTARNAEQRRARAAEPDIFGNEKVAIHQAVRDAAHDAWNGGRLDLALDDDKRDVRENLLDDLFDDYDTPEHLKGDPVAVVAKMCVELGLKLPKEVLADPATDAARIMELARGYLEQTGCAPAPAPDSPDVHGPPDG